MADPLRPGLVEGEAEFPDLRQIQAEIDTQESLQTEDDAFPGPEPDELAFGKHPGLRVRVARGIR